MSYSYVDPASHHNESQQFGVGVRLAYSDDSGRSWVDAGVDLVPFEDGLVGPLPNYPQEPVINANSYGAWNSEVSTLVYDPTAPENERWKLLWHQYLKVNSDEYYFSYGWLAMKMAASPLALEDATPIKLFSGIGLRPESEIATAPAYSPIAGPSAIRLHDGISASVSPGDVNELSQCVFTEPSLYATTTALYLAMDCHDALDRSISYTPLFKCTSPCDVTVSTNWQYLGRVASYEDAVAINRFKLNAPQLLEKQGEHYLIVTPVEDTETHRRYDGCRVYRFEDIDTATLVRTEGVLEEVQRITGLENTFHGACTDHKELNVGIVYGQVNEEDSPEVFQLFQSFDSITGL